MIGNEVDHMSLSEVRHLLDVLAEVRLRDWGRGIEILFNRLAARELELIRTQGLGSGPAPLPGFWVCGHRHRGPAFGENLVAEGQRTPAQG